jgi:hypothetical protein
VIRRWLSHAVACSAAVVSLAALVTFAAAIEPALASPGASSAAAASPIVIDGVSSPVSESGLLSIQLEAPSAISITAVNIESGSVVETSILGSGFTLTSGSNQDGIWTVSSPIPQNAMPFGTYQVTVTATDSGGDSLSNGLAPNSFFFGLDPSVTLAASTTTLSYSQQSVTFTGQVTADDPDGNVVVVPDQTVSVAGDGGDSFTATTDDSGDYSVTGSPAVYNEPSMTESYTASVAASASVQAASSGAIALTAQVYPVQVSVSLSTSTAKFGASVTLSGTALYQAGGIWLPLAQSTIDVTGSDFYSGASVGPIKATTDGSGAFSVLLPDQPTTTWTANPPSSPYLSTTSQPGSVLPNSAVLTVLLPTTVPALHLRYNPAGQLAASACLDLSSAVTSFPDVSPPSGTLSLQYAASRGGPWHTLGALSGGSQSCSHGTAFRKVYNSAPLSAYFRVSYGGKVLYQPTHSAAVHAATVRTRFAGFNVRPRSVSRNGRITMSGELERQTAHSWTALANAKITIVIEPPGANAYWFKKLRVGKSGKFRISFADPQSASWYVAYAGNSTHLSTQSDTIYVTASRS